ANLICCEEKSLLFLHQLGCVVSPFGTPVNFIGFAATTISTRLAQTPYCINWGFGASHRIRVGHSAR
ncbi:hypothetical protein JW992_07630, partial [candidate division KSB1 bacterium]|nr:hypothetical protein [candidate division KSB1 bacterium]